jgi:hypothetical protein
LCAAWFSQWQVNIPAATGKIQHIWIYRNVLQSAEKTLCYRTSDTDVVWANSLTSCPKLWGKISLRATGKEDSCPHRIYLSKNVRVIIPAC